MSGSRYAQQNHLYNRTLHPAYFFLCRCDSIQFSVDRRVFIMGFGLYGSSNGSSNYTVQIELKQSFGPVLASSLCKFSSDGSSNTFKVFFDTPVQVNVIFLGEFGVSAKQDFYFLRSRKGSTKVWVPPGRCRILYMHAFLRSVFVHLQVEPEQHFTASVTLDGAELSYFGQEGMPEVVSGCVTFQFQCAVESTNGTGVQGGQIPELLFYGPTPTNGENRDGTLILPTFYHRVLNSIE